MKFEKNWRKGCWDIKSGRRRRRLRRRRRRRRHRRKKDCYVSYPTKVGETIIIVMNTYEDNRVFRYVYA